MLTSTQWHETHHGTKGKQSGTSQTGGVGVLCRCRTVYARMLRAWNEMKFPLQKGGRNNLKTWLVLSEKWLWAFRKEVFEAEKNISELRLLFRGEMNLVRTENRLCLSPGSAPALKRVCNSTPQKRAQNKEVGENSSQRVWKSFCLSISPG